MRRDIAIAALIISIAAIISHAFGDNITQYTMPMFVQEYQPSIIFTANNIYKPGEGYGYHVDIAPEMTSMSISIAPTYQHNEFRNISLIANRDTMTHKIQIRVLEPAEIPSGWRATLEIRSIDGEMVLGSLDLSRYGELEIELPGGSAVSIYIVTYIPETARLAGFSAKLGVVFT